MWPTTKGGWEVSTKQRRGGTIGPHARKGLFYYVDQDYPLWPLYKLHTLHCVEFPPYLLHGFLSNVGELWNYSHYMSDIHNIMNSSPHNFYKFYKAFKKWYWVTNLWPPYKSYTNFLTSFLHDFYMTLQRRWITKRFALHLYKNLPKPSRYKGC